MSEVEKCLKLENVLVGKRPGWEMSWWENVLVGKRLELENVLVGRSLGWEMSWLEKVWLVNVWLENVWWVNVWLENVLEPMSSSMSIIIFIISFNISNGILDCITSKSIVQLLPANLIGIEYLPFDF